MMNVRYLTAGRNSESDECLTPRCAVLPIVKYLKQKGFKKIWCPFDLEDSMYVRVLKSADFDVIYTHKNVSDGDFFKIEVPECDCIVSNPPFSKKDEILQRLYEIRKPFAILLPQNALQSNFRTGLFIKYGLEYLGFDKRIPFYTKAKGESDEQSYSYPKMSNHFASAYFCNGVLPEKMILENLTVFGEHYYADYN